MKIFKDETEIGKADVLVEADGIYLANFEIYPKYRRNGYSKIVMEYLICKYKIDTLICEADNEIAFRLYEKFGFCVKDKYFTADLDKDVFYMKRETGC